MQDTTDNELLEQFTRDGLEEAFAELVRRHIALVHSVALRHTSNPQQAQDITQAVFVILARKAGSLGRGKVLSGWLYHTARLTAANFRRAEFRRVHREQEAYMQSTLTENAPDPAWRELAPLLDDAMGRLGATDRNAVVLRFFENKSLEEVGNALGLQERAAQKRVKRALEKLRKCLSRRGVTLSATLIAGAVSGNAVQAAPAGLVASVLATSASGVSMSATITTLVKGTMKAMTWLKVKYAAGVSVAALLLGGVATVVVSETTKGPPLTAREIISRSQSAYAALSSYSDEGRIEARVNGGNLNSSFTIRMGRPGLYRVVWTPLSPGGSGDGAMWSAGEGHYLRSNGRTEEVPNLQTSVTRASLLSQNAAGTLPGAFFGLEWGNMLGAVALAPQRQADERVGRVDCYVLTGDLGGVTPTVWLGKKDHLIHQVRSVFSGDPVGMPDLTDDQIRELLVAYGDPATTQAIAEMRAGMQMADQAMRQVPMNGLVGEITETHENIRLNPKLEPSDFAGE